MLHKSVVVLNQSQIMVMTGDLSLPHKVLGEIKYSEPLSGDAIATAHIDDKLRQEAINRYQDRVDAITNLRTGESDNGANFIVSAKAVEVIGPCDFCRHKEVLTLNEPNPAQREVKAPKFTVGDTWIVRFDHSDGTIKVTGVSPFRVTMTWRGHHNTYTPGGNLISGQIGTVNGSFNPNLGTFDFPLWPGKHWSKDWSLRTDEGEIGGTTEGRALDWEKVTVPAGTLDALKLKIEYSTPLTDTRMTCWYAPEVKAFVKCDTTNANFQHQRLVSYRPGSATASR